MTRSVGGRLPGPVHPRGAGVSRRGRESAHADSYLPAQRVDVEVPGLITRWNAVVTSERSGALPQRQGPSSAVLSKNPR